LPPCRSILSKLALFGLFLTPLAFALEGEPEPVVIEDPHYGDVLFHFYQEDYFSAIVRLLAAMEREQLEEHSEEAELLLGGMYLSYGHHLEAADIFERILAGNVAPDQRNRTWFFLAKIWYQRGYLDRAREALNNIDGALPQNLASEARLLDAQIRIAAGDYDTAIARLSDFQDPTEWSSYAKFNVGVALVRSGRVAEAISLLDEIGRMQPFTEEMAALRDKANLALGYALLQDGQAAAAREPLQRVRLEGPFSNKALLGVGWADAQMEEYSRALVPWMELRGRDLLDPAVQESMLAIPYAMSQLDSLSQAADNYINAIEAFTEESTRIDQAIGRIRSGEFFETFFEQDRLDGAGWFWSLDTLPQGTESSYLYHLLATNRFQEGLKNYRDLRYLHHNLDTWRNNVDVYDNMLETQLEKFARSLAYVRDSLELSRLDDFVQDKLVLDGVLGNVQEDTDWLALADDREFEMWQEVTTIENNAAVQSDVEGAADVRDKIDLIKGVLQWNLERDFGDRLTGIAYDLQDTGEALIEAQRARRKIEETMRTEPQRYAALRERVDGLAPRIDGMLTRVDSALGQQRDFLQEIAVEELQTQKDRLDIYMIQARFALAAIYDIAATSDDAPASDDAATSDEGGSQ
jgi:hypothetical protein